MKKQISPCEPSADPLFLLALRGIFVLSFCLVGLYYELAAAVVSALLLALLLWKGRKKNKLAIHINDAMLAICGVSLFYFLSCFWAVDSGMALWGGVKYLPLPLFALCLMQIPKEDRLTMLGDIPWLGGVMTLVSFVLQFIPLFSSSFSVSGRLAGFFLYPNTFACFLLLGMAVLLTKKRSYPARWMKPLCVTVLLFGLFQAGSRTIFLLTIPVVLACLLLRRDKNAVALAVLSILCGGLVSLAVSLLGGIGGTERVLAISSGASTLLGRLLYWKDALPVILRHPFGLGYLGYFFMQGSFQTGVYSVRWVHNDFLQLLLDVGWLPALLAVVAVFRALFSKNISTAQRVIMLTLLAHCMTDFDLEFVAMYFILLLCLDWDDQKARFFTLPTAPGTAVSAALCALSLYIGAASTLTYSGLHQAAAALYPWNTLSQMELMTQTDDVTEVEALADKILARNESVSLAWDGKALAAYAQGDFGTMMTCKRQAIALARYDLEEYTDYFEKLAVGYQLYQNAGDTASAAACLEEIQSLQSKLDTLAEETDPLAWRLADTPTLTMPEEYNTFLATLGLG